MCLIFIYTILINLVLASNSNQCLRYNNQNIPLETCSAQLPIDFSAALFPDPAIVISSLTRHHQPSSPTQHTQPTVKVIPTINLFSDTNATSSQDEPKPLVSFEEWQKKVLQENEKDRRHKRKTTEKKTPPSLKKQQMVDSIDGGFSDDFGSMLEELIGKKEKKPNVYDEGEYIAPSQSGDINTNKKVQQFASVRMKSLKERFNYASTDCAATVRKSNKEAKGAQSILYESKDQYLLNRCSADKFVIINLCEQIVVDTIVMANFEFFSSTFKDFRVYASSKYPTQDWRLLGQWQARNTRDLQVFKVPDSGFVEYMKIEFITHYGHEYYCPLSLVRVHGMSMMEYYTTVESQGDDPIIEDEHLWPAEVREQLIQPQFDVTNTSESFPIKIEQEEEDIKQLIPPVNYDVIVETPVLELDEVETEITVETVHSTIKESMSIELARVESSLLDDLVMPTQSESVGQETSNIESASISSIPSSINDISSTQKEELQADTSSSSSIVHSEDTTTLTSDTTIAIDTPPSISLSTSTSTLSSTATEEPNNRSPHPPQQKVAPYPKEGSTQESIYKTIMKRLNGLEGNMTLSLRYLDDQNKNLNDVLKDMERNHQAQLIQLIGHLNDTASQRIDNMKRRYEQWYEDLKDQTDSDMREMAAKINILADQLSFERRVSVCQLVIMITLFVFMALSRGTFSTLSPVMAAQQEERKRRESIDHSSSSKEIVDLLLETPTKLEAPKKPNNPRRHSDYPYHIMGEGEIHKNNTLMNNSLGIELQSDNILSEQKVPLLNRSSRKTSLENLGTKDESSSIKNRKRSCTSPSVIEL
ncbi:UNC-like C-terminal-domain-containing protein [Thamnidium elegans]|nr:UNC-like C-terminal-domain-containing protein [Thamnidium elegans]